MKLRITFHLQRAAYRIERRDAWTSTWCWSI